MLTAAVSVFLVVCAALLVYIGLGVIDRLQTVQERLVTTEHRAARLAAMLANMETRVPGSTHATKDAEAPAWEFDISPRLDRTA